jgi:hypothetical protein
MVLNKKEQKLIKLVRIRVKLSKDLHNIDRKIERDSKLSNEEILKLDDKAARIEGFINSISLRIDCLANPIIDTGLHSIY